MSNVELGLNRFIERDGNGKSIVTRDLRISLKNKPIGLDDSDSLPGNNVLSRKEKRICRMGPCGQVRFAL